MARVLAAVLHGASLFVSALVPEETWKVFPFSQTGKSLRGPGIVYSW